MCRRCRRGHVALVSLCSLVVAGGHHEHSTTCLRRARARSCRGPHARHPMDSAMCSGHRAARAACGTHTRIPARSRAPPGVGGTFPHHPTTHHLAMRPRSTAASRVVRAPSPAFCAGRSLLCTSTRCAHDRTYRMPRRSVGERRRHVHDVHLRCTCCYTSHTTLNCIRRRTNTLHEKA